MKFTASALALFVNLVLSAAVPAAEPVGMVQKLSARAVSGDVIFGRSFSCAANNPTTCCAVSLHTLYDVFPCCYSPHREGCM